LRDKTIVALILTCLVALLAPLLVPLATRRVLAYDDIAAIHLPLRFLYQRALSEGDSILWSPSFFSGVYLFGEGQAGMAHPLHIALYRFLPLDVALNLEIVASYVMGAIGARFALAAVGMTTPAAWFGALVFAFCGYNLTHFVHINAVSVIAHAPWLMWATVSLVRNGSVRARAAGFGGVALTVGSALLVGYPQYVLFIIMATGLCLLLALIGGETPLQRMVLWSAAIVLGTTIGAIQLWPTAETLRASIRWNPSMTFRLSYSLPPIDLVQLWSPAVFKAGVIAPDTERSLFEFRAYDGAFAVLAVAWIAIRARRIPHRRLVLALLAVAATGVVLALGRNGVLYERLAAFPPFSSVRAPARHIVLVYIALAGIMAAVFDDLLGLLRRGERIAMPLLWPLAIVILLATATMIAADRNGESAWQATAPWLAMMIAITLVLIAAACGNWWALPLLIVLVAADLGLYGYSLVLPQGRWQSIEHLAAAANVPPQSEPGDLFQQGATGNGPAENLGVLRRLRLATGYLGLPPGTVLPSGATIALGVAGARWMPNGGGWAAVPSPMPRARLLSEARIAPTPEDVRASIDRIDITTVALVNQAVGRLGGAPGSVRIVVDRPGRISVDAHAPNRQLLVLTERFHEGWEATTAGRALPIVRAYGDYLACVVDGDTTRIDFTFHPRSFRNGALVSTAGLLLTVIGCIVVARRGW
jgi:hypothetical protein